MNRGLLAKCIREAWPLTVVFAVSIAAFEALFAAVVHSIPEDLTKEWLQLDVMQNFLQGLLGTDIGELLMAEAFGALAWVHPVVLAILWAHALTACTRMPAGEIDRGSIDIILGLPLSRWSLYAGTSAITSLSGAIVTAAALAGHLLGRQFTTPTVPIGSDALAIIIINLFCMYLAVVGMSCLLSAACDRRGRAVAIILAIILSMFALDFLAPFWTPARSCSFLSILHYHRPLAVVRQAVWPATDLIVLLAAGGICWLLGGVLFSQRDIKTV